MWTRAIHQLSQEMVILNPCLTRERIGSVFTGVHPVRDVFKI